VHPKTTTRWILFLALLVGLLNPSTSTRAAQVQAKPLQADPVTAFDLILAMNTLRTSNGLPALVEDPIIMAVAQSTAEIMAANQMSWHIGNVSGRVASAGYGGGAKVWATENFAVGNMGIDEIMVVWSDASHMIPAVNAAYCNVGAGVAKSPNGMKYYVLQAAYISGKSCGEYTSPGGSTAIPGGGRTGGVSQIIVPVKIATPDADGKIYHVVKAGQSFWSIAVAYKITIKDLEVWNNISKNSKLQIGQKLFIPSSSTKGYATPTPVGMIQVSTPDVDGKIIHTVQSYQTLSTIAQAYGTNLDRILTLNRIQADWPLQIGQKLVISPGNVTPSPTPRPLTPLEKLTPASDGKYYHIIKSGETLSWIASLYNVQVKDLMVWNSLNEASIIHPEEKLVLQVTPPATATRTPGPATDTPTVTLVPPTQTATLTPTLTQEASQPTSTLVSSAKTEKPSSTWLLIAGVVISGFVLALVLSRRKR
jgi:LysM repeat protein